MGICGCVTPHPDCACHRTFPSVPAYPSYPEMPKGQWIPDSWSPPSTTAGVKIPHFVTGLSVDKDLQLLLTRDEGQMTRDEMDSIKEIFEYIKNTYSEHYAGEYENIQIIDAIINQGNGVGYLAGAAQKYVARFGKKHGRNRGDILKAIHHLILLLHEDNLYNEKHNAKQPGTNENS